MGHSTGEAPGDRQELFSTVSGVETWRESRCRHTRQQKCTGGGDTSSRQKAEIYERALEGKYIIFSYLGG